MEFVVVLPAQANGEIVPVLQGTGSGVASYAKVVRICRKGAAHRTAHFTGLFKALLAS